MDAGEGAGDLGDKGVEGDRQRLAAGHQHVIMIGFAGVIALVLTLVLSLASVMGPLGGGLVATLVTMLMSGGLGLAAFKSWKAGE